MCFNTGTVEREYVNFKNMDIKEKVIYIVNIIILISFASLIGGFFIVNSYLSSENIPISSFSGNDSIIFLILFINLF
ncbi:MAG: hypothetical protein ACYCUT_03670, partial [bacterium]